MDYLMERAGGTTSAMLEHSLSYIDTITELDNHRLLFTPRIEMTLEEQLRASVSKSKVRAQQKANLITMYKIVRIPIQMTFVLN